MASSSEQDRREDAEDREFRLRVNEVGAKGRPDPQGYYTVLGVGADADASAVRKAFLHQSTLFHTDRHYESTAEQRQAMNERFQRINEAYQVLSDPRRRAAYDHAGTVGIDRLELLPTTVSERSDVQRALDALEREAEVRRLAKMVGAAGSVEISLNAVQWIATRALPPAAERHSPTPTSSGAAAATAAPQLQLSGAQMTLSVAEINGVRKLVLVPADGVLEEAMPPEARAQLQRVLGTGARSGQRSAAAGLVQSIKGSHQFQHAIGNSVALLFRAEAAQERGGTNSGSLLTRVVYAHSTILSLAAAIRVSLDRLRFGVTITRALSPVSSLIAKLVVHDGRSLLPAVSLTLKRALTERLSLASAVKWTTSAKGGSYTCTLTEHVDAEGRTARGAVLQISHGSLQLSAFHTAPMRLTAGSLEAEGSRTVSVAADCLKGTTTATCQFWWDRSAFHSVGFGLVHQLPITISPFAPPFFLLASSQYVGFTQYSLLYRRGEHTITLPVVVSLSPSALSALAVAVIPFALWAVGMRVVRPVIVLREARKLALRRKERAAEVAEARQKALLEQEAIRSEVLVRQQREGKNGLVIMNAKFGVLHPVLPVLKDEPRPEVVDVTLSLQSYVRDSMLELPEGDFTKLAGFYDPDPASAELKHLRVQYWWNQRKHEVEVVQGSALHLPDEEHRVRPPPA